jgi:hypothetical protein
MSCLIHALIPSKMLGNEDAEDNPDKHGGFEMGTWSFPPYLYLFAKVIGNYDWLGTPRVINERGRWGSKFTFTKDQCAAMAKWLSRRRKVRKGAVTYYYYGRYTKGGGLWPNTMRIKPKWHKRLMELFRSGEVTYYSK